MAETYSNLQYILSDQQTFGKYYGFNQFSKFNIQLTSHTSEEQTFNRYYGKNTFTTLNANFIHQKSFQQTFDRTHKFFLFMTLNIDIAQKKPEKQLNLDKYYPPDLSSGNVIEIIEHNISIDIDTKKITSHFSLNDGTEDTKQYDFTNEYNQIQSLVDADLSYNTNGINIEFIANLTNGKILTKNWQLTKLDAEKLYAALKSFYSKFNGLWIKVDDLEYVFPIVDGEKQPELNVANNKAINGSLEYVILGNPSNKWSFEVYVDDYSKILVLEQLLHNPVCYVKFDEIGDYRQCLITDMSYSRNIVGKYIASIELTIL
ncbi:hypothetical protein KKP97_05235 [Methanothermococcus sp. SCGC AD-155-C09]|nr:hypothetical protein [Methanothermococcus sp. SCGC AD-155-C09]